MKTYTITQLQDFKKPDIENIIKERGELLLNLVSQILKNKNLKAFSDKETNEASDDNFFTISNVELKDSTKSISHLDINNVLLLNLKLEAKLNKEVPSDIIYNEEAGTSRMNKIVAKFIDKEARILWSINKIENTTNIEINLLFPDKLIIPEIVLFNEYKKLSKKAKKQDKENYREEFENKLRLEIEELSTKRFNLIRNNPSYFPEDREELIAFIKKSNKKFDKEAVRNVIKKYSDDEEIIMHCIGLFNHSLFQHVSEKLKNDRNFIIKMLDYDVNILEHAPEKFRDDDEIMNKAINKSGYIIRTASNRLKNNKDFCLTAIKNQAHAYGEIPDSMKEDNDLLTEVMKHGGQYLMYSQQVKTNKELLIQAFATAFPPQSRNLLSLTSEEFKNDKEVALAAIKCNSQNIMEISQELREEIGTEEPIEYLTNYLFNVKLNDVTPEKGYKVSKKKI